MVIAQTILWILEKVAVATVIISERKGRAAQMNTGASFSQYDLLYFLHADSIPPNDFTTQIIQALKPGVKSGCFRLAFDYDHWFLKANAWFTLIIPFPGNRINNFNQLVIFSFEHSLHASKLTNSLDFHFHIFKFEFIHSSNFRRG